MTLVLADHSRVFFFIENNGLFFRMNATENVNQLQTARVSTDFTNSNGLPVFFRKKIY